MLSFLFIFFILIFCIVLIFCFYSFFQKESFFWLLFYFVLFLTCLFLSFFYQDIKLFYLIIHIVSQQGKNLIVLGDGQELLFLLIELSVFLTIFLFFPVAVYICLNFFLTMWTVQEIINKDFIFFLFFYFYFLGFWIFYQDIGFSSWEIFRLIGSQGLEHENGKYLSLGDSSSSTSSWLFQNKMEVFGSTLEDVKSWSIFFTVFDYQPQLETICSVLKREIVDLFLWESVLYFSFFFFFCTSITKYAYFFEYKRNWKFHCLCFLFFLLGFYFFFGGDGFFLDFLFLVMSWLFFEFWVFSFYFFSFLKKYKYKK